MPRPNIGRRKFMFREDPAILDAERAREAALRGVDVDQVDYSDVIRKLLAEAVAARARRDKIANRRQTFSA